VNRLVEQFKQMQKMMKSLRGMGPGSRMLPRLPGLR
jgi:signal recognition particle GTPase